MDERYNRLLAIIQIATLIVTIFFLIVTRNSYLEAKKSNILTNMPLICAKDYLELNITPIEDKKGVYFEVQVLYTIKSQGNTPIVDLSCYADFRRTLTEEPWTDVVDTTLTNILLPGNDIQFSTSRKLGLLSYNEETYKQISALVEKGLKVSPIEEGKLLVPIEDNMYFRIKCKYKDVLENEYIYYANYLLELNPLETHLEYRARLLNSRIKIIE